MTYVVYDGSGNCPYQKSFARYEARRMEVQKQLIEQGVDKKSAAKRAVQQTRPQEFGGKRRLCF